MKDSASVDDGHLLSSRRSFNEFKCMKKTHLLAQTEQVLNRTPEVDERAGREGPAAGHGKLK
jgi:hypothetical protein